MTAITRTYSTKARLDLTPEAREYLDAYFPVYGAFFRAMYRDIRHGAVEATEGGLPKYVTAFCVEHGILKRTANSLRNDVEGRIKAYRELKAAEMAQLAVKLASVADKIADGEGTVAKLKPKVAANKATERQLQEYRKAKASLYWAKNKLNRFIQRKAALEAQIASGDVSICWGTKRLFRKQGNLRANGYRSHGRWLRDFREARDCGLFYLGSHDEKCGNQMASLSYDPATGTFALRVRKEKAFCPEGARRNDPGDYVVIRGLRFKHLGPELAEAVADGKRPVSCRFCRKGRKVYVVASFSRVEPVTTTAEGGAVGIDYNDGFMELAETDAKGNLVGGRRVPLRFHGGGGMAENEVRQAVHAIVADAAVKGKDMAVERLDFRKKKARVLPGKGKAHNRMLHALDYSRYGQTLRNACARQGVGLSEVNPAFTSVAGRAKYAGPMKLSAHRAAAFVIARKGQGFDDTKAYVRKSA